MNFYQEKIKMLMMENELNPEFFDYTSVQLFMDNLSSTIRKVGDNEEIYTSVPIFSIAQWSEKNE